MPDSGDLYAIYTYFANIACLKKDITYYIEFYIRKEWFKYIFEMLFNISSDLIWLLTVSCFLSYPSSCSPDACDFRYYYNVKYRSGHILPSHVLYIWAHFVSQPHWYSQLPGNMVDCLLIN